MRSFIRPFLGGIGHIDPILALNPLLYLRADAGVLATGGGEAGVGESVALWEDQSGNGNDAAQTTAASQPTRQDGSVDLDGVDDFLQLGYLSEVDHGTPFTVSLWLNVEAQSGSKALWSNYDGSNNGVQLSLDASRALQVLRRVGGVGTFLERSTVINTGLSLITVVHDGSDYALHLDGVLLGDTGETSPALGGLNGSAGFYIGAKDNGSNNYKTFIKNFTIIPRELTSQEVLELYNSLTA
jgi:hypothetical protein